MADPERPSRRSVRLKACDYARPGGYFVTVCTADRRRLFGTVAEGQVHLNRFGRIAEAEWQQTAELRSIVELGEHIVMPNHVHGVIFIMETGDPEPGSQPERRVAGHRAFGRADAGSLASVVGGFKAAVTRRINAVRKTPGGSVWQPNYYDHVVRSAEELDRIAYYIRTNPERWDRDRENPRARVVDDGWPFEERGMSTRPIEPEGR
jgi:REP element-mobilizing transposase RayT